MDKPMQISVFEGYDGAAGKKPRKPRGAPSAKQKAVQGRMKQAAAHCKTAQKNFGGSHPYRACIRDWFGKKK